jgi:hypothetical protein
VPDKIKVYAEREVGREGIVDDGVTIKVPSIAASE